MRGIHNLYRSVPILSIVLLALLLAMPDYGLSSVLYVSQSGVDATGDGSSDNPFRTIQKGIDSGASGDTVLVAGGTYSDGSGEPSPITVKAGITVLGAGPDVTLIDSVGVRTDSGVTNCRLSGFTIAHASVGFIAESGGTGVVLSNNVIVHNNTGVKCVNSEPLIKNNTIVNNTGGQGGIWIETASYPTIRNNIIVDNGAYGIYNGSGGLDPDNISYNDVWDHDKGSYGNYSSDPATDISEDPLFVDAAGDDFHLQLGSPCIDRGDPTYEYSDEPMPNGGRINMGAYGNTGGATTSPISRTVVLNELMWMGSAASTADEWIELRNTTDADIDLSGWTLEKAATGGGTLTIPAGKTIPARAYFLIANYSNTSENSMLAVEPDWETTTISLPNTQLQIILKDANGEIIDIADDGIGDPAAGDDTNRYAMVRRLTSPGDGTSASSWFTATASIGWDAGATERGTPGSLVVTAAPKGLTASGGNRSVALIWDANTEPDLAYYVVYRDTVSFTPTPGDSIGRVNPDTTYTDSAVVNGETYSYRISAVDSLGGKSRYSDEVSATALMYGDVSGNWEVTPFDAALILKERVGLITLPDASWPSFTEAVADVSGASGISAYDAALVLRYAVGRITAFPVEGGAEKAVASSPRTVSLGDAESLGDGTFLIPILIDEMSGVLSGHIEAFYDPVAFKALEARNGDRTKDYLFVSNIVEDRILMSFAGVGSSEGGGRIAELVLTPVDIEGDVTPEIALREVRLNEGKLEVSWVVSVSSESRAQEVPTSYRLGQNTPNPFNSVTTLSFDLPSGGLVHLAIYTLTGQQIRTLVDAERKEGRYSVRWDGRDEHGRDVASGIYLYRIRCGEFVSVRRMVFLQ